MDALSAFERILRDLLVFVVAMSVVLAALLRHHLAHAERQSAEADPGRAQLSRGRHGGGGDARHSRDPDPRPRRHRRFRRAARPHLVLVDLLPQRAPPSAPETSRHEIHEGQRPRHPLSRPGPARRAGARLHQFARDRLPHLERGRRNPRARFPDHSYDKRGHGLSESGPDKNDMADYSRDLVGFWMASALDARRSSDCRSEVSSRRSFTVRIRSASRRSCSATLQRRSEPTKSGTSASLRSSAAELKRSPTPSCNGGSRPISAPHGLRSLPACAQCSSERRDRAISRPAAP